MIGTVGMVQANEELANLPREKTLYMAGEQWSAPATFNPLAGVSDWPVAAAADVLIYETLFAMNMVTSELDPLLATGYEWTDDLTLQVTMDGKAHWQNGDPLTAEDVEYTFDLASKYPLEYSNIWDVITDVEMVDEATVEFTLNPDNPNRLLLLHQLAFTRILPKAIFTKVEEENNNDIAEIRKWKNREAIGSGPYTIASYSDQRIVLQRDENYWGNANWGKPAPKYIAHVIYKSNDAGNRALEAGQVDISQQFIPQVWKMWEDKNLPIHTWYDEPPYYVSSRMPSLIVNTTKKPMDDPAFRRALAHAIDYQKIAQLAMTQYSSTMQAGLIMPTEPYFDKTEVEQYGWKYDPDKAVEILEEAGYYIGTDGFYRTPDGEEISLTAQCPYGWSDWMVSLKIVAQSARDIGINIREKFPETPVWDEELRSGDFDLTMEVPTGMATPANPWLRFRNSVYSVGVPEIGGLAFRNWGRYKNEKADELIERLPLLSDEVELQATYNELNRLVMEEAPIIPLEYRPWLFYTYSTQYWTGFANEENPYAPPQMGATGAGIRILYNLEPVAQ